MIKAREAGDRIIAPLQGADILSNPIQGWCDLRSLTPGYHLPPLRGWLSSATQLLKICHFCLLIPRLAGICFTAPTHLMSLFSTAALLEEVFEWLSERENDQRQDGARYRYANCAEATRYADRSGHPDAGSRG
jgi:hypothetical protein